MFVALFLFVCLIKWEHKKGKNHNDSSDYPSEVSFQCRNGWGKNCRVAVENVATNTCSMKVVFYHDINGDSVTTERTVKVGDVGVTFVESTTGADLTCRIDTTISPYRGVTVDWKYDCDQH